MRSVFPSRGSAHDIRQVLRLALLCAPIGLCLPPDLGPSTCLQRHASLPLLQGVSVMRLRGGSERGGGDGGTRTSFKPQKRTKGEKMLATNKRGTWNQPGG
eukprot:668025-Rhodomonas_salina.1